MTQALYGIAKGLTENQFYGTIQVHRMNINAKDKTKTDDTVLTYIDPQTFNDYIENNDLEALKFFTMDKYSNLIIATWSSHQIDYSISPKAPADMVFPSEPETYSLYTKTIAYKAAVNKYTMPYEFLGDLLAITENPTFCRGVAALVFNSHIIITVEEELTETTTKDTREYTDTIKKYEDILSYTITANGVPYSDQHSFNIKSDEEGDVYAYIEDPIIYTITSVSTTKANKYTIEITEADTWIAHYKKDYGDMKAVPKHTTEEKSDPGKFGEKETITETKLVNPYIQARIGEITANLLQQNPESTPSVYCSDRNVSAQKSLKRAYTGTITTDTTEYKKTDNPITTATIYAVDRTKSPPEYQKFLKIYDSNKQVQGKLEEDDWKDTLLKEDAATINFIDIIKYLLYQYDGKYREVKNLNSVLYEISNGNDLTPVGEAGKIDSLKNFIHHWEGKPKTNDDLTKYIVFDDGAGNLTVGWGIAINAHKDALIAGGADPSQFVLGGQIDISIVDNVENQILQEIIKKVQDTTNGLGLNDAQIAALVSRVYNCGSAGGLGVRNGKNFVQAYTEYGNKQPLYDNYMSMPITSNGKVMQGLVTRRLAEWRLFNEGFNVVTETPWYVPLNGGTGDGTDQGWDDQYNGILGGDFLQNADRIYHYMRAHGYSYCLDSRLPGSFGSMASTPYTCCATYVSWVLYESGYTNGWDGINRNWAPYGGVQTYCERQGFQKITSYSQIQPGDIVICNYGGHVQIYAGNGLWYSAGNNTAIKSNPIPYSQGNWARSTFVCAYRVPNR